MTTMQERPSARPKGSREVIGDWAQKVSRELNSDVGQPRKGNKDKEIFYLLCTALVVAYDDVAPCYNVGVLTRRQVGS